MQSIPAPALVLAGGPESEGIVANGGARGAMFDGGKPRKNPAGNASLATRSFAGIQQYDARLLGKALT